MFVNPEFLFTRIAEPDWSNNNGSKAVIVSPPVLDLALVSLDIEPSEVHEGDLMTVNCTIRNNGDRTAENLTVRLLFDDEPLFGRATDLQAGDTFSFATQNDTSTYEPGDHVLRLVAGNINSSRVITLLGIRMADLLPKNLSFSPQRPDVNQAVLISLDVVNAGSAPAGPCRLSLFLDYNNTEVTGVDVPALDPGAGNAVLFLWNTTGITAVTHWLRLLVDSGFDVIESNETNNTIVWSVGFSGVMDLAMDTVTVAPSGPRTGDIVQFSAKVMNIGSIPTGAASVTLKVQDSPVDVRGLGVLDPKTSRNATLWWNTAGLAPGLYEYEVVVSSTGSATDADLGNNNLTGLIDLLPHIPGPDLRVGGINISPPSPRVGDELVLSITVQNIGNLDSGQCSLMVYLETGLAFLKFTDVPVLLPPIPAGGSLRINASRGTGNYGAGSYTINVTVDYRNELVELNETNNNFLQDFQLLPQIPKAPVLGVGSVTVDGKLREGSTLNILAVVTNTGDADALGVNVTLIIDNEPAGRLTLDVISAGSNRTATFAWKPTSGTHTIQVKAETEDAPQATGSMQTVSITGKPAGGGGGTLMLGLAAVVVIVAAAAGAGVLLMRRKKGSGPG